MRVSEIGFVNAVQINDYDFSETEQGSVLQNLIPQCTRADDQQLAGSNLRLVPPGDQPETAIAVLLKVSTNYGFHEEPAVISGWSRRISPSCTWA